MKMSLKKKILLFPLLLFLVILTIGFLTVMTVQDKIGTTHTDSQRVVEEITFKIIFSGFAGLLIALFLSIFLISSIDRPIHEVIDSLEEGIKQVSSASAQVSQASQNVAQGTSEQASGIEEISSSLEEIASVTKQNSHNAHQVKVVMNEARQIVEKVQYHMSQMGQAMTEITGLSEKTSKIIRTIDEIAFQTNLLALNAAVEAARAGEAGAGFSVVANEVRNLAMKASEAARNTSHLIENTIKAVRKGNDLTQSTQDANKENIEIAGKHTTLIDEIAVASQEQAQAIQQLAAAVVQMNKVTQASAASAEESASASEELNSQVEQVDRTIRELVAIVGDSNGTRHGDSRVIHQARPAVKRHHHSPADFFSLGAGENQDKVTERTVPQKNRRSQKGPADKRSVQKDPEKVIPFHEGKEKDEEVLRNF